MESDTSLIALQFARQTEPARLKAVDDALRRVLVEVGLGKERETIEKVTGVAWGALERTAPTRGAVILNFTSAHERLIGGDAARMLDWMYTGLMALAVLRQDPPNRAPAERWHLAISDLSARLLPHLGGILDAVIRAHAESGGTYGQLAEAMAAPKGTAQSRRNRVMGKPPALLEQWACGQRPAEAQRARAAVEDLVCQGCGNTQLWREVRVLPDRISATCDPCGTQTERRREPVAKRKDGQS